jgi:hypothetical protein
VLFFFQNVGTLKYFWCGRPLKQFESYMLVVFFENLRISCKNCNFVFFGQLIDPQKKIRHHKTLFVKAQLFLLEIRSFGGDFCRNLKNVPQPSPRNNYELL